ncbi:hypothetical protein ABB02_01371 [Clostridiaceae bacterium JG1575]|nr:hypothetical protein ABB02_01371 [Clostridiaceae bacterium JG1575]
MEEKEQPVTGQKKSARKKGWLWLLIGIVGVALLGFLIRNAWLSARPVHKYQTATLRVQDPLVLRGSATPKEMVSFMVDRTKGELAEIKIKDRETVKKGDLLFTYRSRMASDALDDAKRQQKRAQEAVASAKKDLEKAKSDLQSLQKDLKEAEATQIRRQKELDAAKEEVREAQESGDPAKLQALAALNQAVSEKAQAYSEAGAEVAKLSGKTEGLEAQMSGMERAVTQAESAKSDADVLVSRAQRNDGSAEVAPFDGVALVHESNQSTPGKPVVEVMTPEVQVVGTVTEFDYRRLSLQQEVDLLIVPTREPVKGKVIQIDQTPKSETISAGALNAGAAGGVSYGFIVAAEKFVHPGYSVEIRVALPALLLPPQAVVKEDGQHFVWRVADGKVKKTAVDIVKDGLALTVKAGVKVGDVIIANPDGNLTEDAIIEVEKP